MKSHHASSAETLFLFPKKSRKDDSTIDARKVKILIFILSSAGREKLVLKSCDLFRGNEFNIFAFRTISVLRGRISLPKQVPHTIVLEIKTEKRKRRYANGKKSGKTSSCTERVATAGSLERKQLPLVGRSSSRPWTNTTHTLSHTETNCVTFCTERQKPPADEETKQLFSPTLISSILFLSPTNPPPT